MFEDLVRELAAGLALAVVFVAVFDDETQGKLRQAALPPPHPRVPAFFDTGDFNP